MANQWYFIWRHASKGFSWIVTDTAPEQRGADSKAYGATIAACHKLTPEECEACDSGKHDSDGLRKKYPAPSE